MVFRSIDFGRISKLLSGKYGKPHHTDLGTVQNGFGANFDQITMTWNTIHGPMKLYFYYPDLDHSALILRDRNFTHQAELKKNQMLQEKGKKAF